MNYDQSTGTMQFWNGTSWSFIGPPQFQDVPFNAADYQGFALAWTVAAGNIGSFRFLDYLAPTKMLFVNLFLSGSTMAGGPTANLIQIKIPNGRVPVGWTNAIGFAGQGGASGTPGTPPFFPIIVTALSPFNHFFIQRMDGTEFNVDAVGTAISFQITFHYA
jgi:hypothetical protein